MVSRGHRSNSINSHFTSGSLVGALLKTTIFGVLIGELFFLSQAIAKGVLQLGVSSQERTWLFVLIALSLLVVAYLLGEEDWRTAKKLAMSKRPDHFGAIILGLLASVSIGGLGTAKYQQVLGALTKPQLLLVLWMPTLFGLLVVIRSLQLRYLYPSEPEHPFFISDREAVSLDDDLLGFSQDARRFAERALNGTSSESVVFGIDGPWGIGKSTFVNLCVEYWAKECRDRVIVFRFNPLLYEDRSKLMEKFVDGLAATIRHYVFLPEIGPLASHYSRLIRVTKPISIGGFDLNLFASSETIDDAFHNLHAALAALAQKIIVIIDDLDRMEFSAIQQMLFALKKGFFLPNVSFILCYDAENIAALEKYAVNRDKLSEFMEKFIDVKFSLFLSSANLRKYISDNLDRALVGNSQADPKLISTALEGLRDIYENKEYARYASFVGDLRKVKRLLNVILFLDVEKTDFENSDFDKRDLINLLLLYVNYPSIFRKIYNTETNGREGFFSVVSHYDEHGSGQYKNSTLFTDYVKTLDHDSRFLVTSVFEVSTRLGGKTQTNAVPIDARRSWACFNDSKIVGDERNLEAYLRLIVEGSKPQTRDQYRFYVNIKDELLKGARIEEILSRDTFSNSMGEASHEQFWRVVVNSLEEFDSKRAGEVIHYLANNIQRYSLLRITSIDLGLRRNLIYFLLKVLDTAGWSDENGQHRNNTDENIAQIAEWIFAEGQHADAGLLDTLANATRGILGLYDLMVLRLYCCADQGGNLFSVMHALTNRAEPGSSVSGVPVQKLLPLEMREISQRTFAIFRTQYIDLKNNIFDAVERLTLDDLAGSYSDYVRTRMAAHVLTEADLSRAIAATKSTVLGFVIYQLGSTRIESGIGCGYYDESGKADKNGIAAAMNGYLFEQCFNPALSKDAYLHLLDYLLMNFRNQWSLDGQASYVATVAAFINVLSKDRLVGYWKSHSGEIRKLGLESSERTVTTVNYIASYREDVAQVYEVLDKMVADGEQGVMQPDTTAGN